MLTNNTERVTVLVMHFEPIIARWGISELASDLSLPAKNVRRWVDQDSIPAEWFVAVARAAETRGFKDISVERLARVAEERRLHRRRA